MVTYSPISYFVDEKYYIFFELEVQKNYLDPNIQTQAHISVQ